MDNSIEYCRQYRNTMNGIVDYILSNEKSVREFGDSLTWSDLESIPIWLLWKKSQIDHLALIAGTIFLLPSIKIWIDSKKIREVSELVGEDVFDFILSNTHVDNQRVISLNITNVKENLLSAGASVIFSCYNIRIRPWLSHTLPKSKGKLESVLANEILKHAIYVLENTRSNIKVEDRNNELPGHSK